MLSNLIRNVLSSAISGVINGSSGDIPPLNERYFTQLDGQSKFFRREAVWECVDPVVEVVFLGYEPTTTYMLFDGDLTGNARAFAFINANTGYVNCPNAQTLELNGVAVTPNTSAAKPVEGELNRIRVSFTGTFKVQVLGCRFARDAAFAPTIIESIKLIDSADTANTFNYPLDENLPYELPDGVTLTELWGGAPIVGAGWTDNGGGSYTCDGTSGSLLLQAIPATINSGDEVEVTYKVSNYVSGGVRSLTYGTSDVAVGSSRSTNGVFTQIVTINSNTGSAPNRAVLQSFPNFIGTVSNISFKAIPNSALVFENGSIDGSDRLLVTKKEDGTGFVGETGIEYDYATGAAPVDSYGTEYSTAYS